MKKKILTLGIVLALVSVLVMPTAALATTTDVGGDVIEGYTFTAPTPVEFGNMNPNDTPSTADTTGYLQGNNAGGYNVKGIDANTDGTTKGFMLIGPPATPTSILENKLKMGDTVAVPNDADVETTFLDTSTITDEIVPFYVSQTVEFTDPIATGYTITITFTVTQN